MGKTNPTYRQSIQAWCDSWQPFERALRRQHRETFQEMLSYAHEHAMAGGIRIRRVSTRWRSSRFAFSSNSGSESSKNTLVRLNQMSNPVVAIEQ